MKNYKIRLVGDVVVGPAAVAAPEGMFGAVVRSLSGRDPPGVFSGSSGPGAVVGAATHDAPSRPAALRPLVQALLVSRADRAGLCVPVGEPPRSYRAGSRRSSPFLAL